jgi:phosphoribosylglycinamide formyltransferase-1
MQDGCSEPDAGAACPAVRVAILISGAGSNMVALVQSMRGAHPARPVLVVSSDPDAAGLDKARAMGVATAVVDHRRFGADRAGFEAALGARLAAAAPDLICLAGFMRILSPGFVAHWEGRMLNIHPSLLPRHRGLDTHARVIAAGDVEHGCTVHLVTADLDGGPILGTARIAVGADDTPRTLAARVLAEEHRLYPAVLRRLAEGKAAPLHPGV